MKTSSIVTVLVPLCMASAHTAKTNRKRTQTQHKLMDKAQAATDESYEPYLGMDERTRKLMAHGDHLMAMSMSIPNNDNAKYSGDGPLATTNTEVTPGSDSNPIPNQHLLLLLMV